MLEISDAISLWSGNVLDELVSKRAIEEMQDNYSVQQCKYDNPEESNSNTYKPPVLFPQCLKKLNIYFRNFQNKYRSISLY